MNYKNIIFDVDGTLVDTDKPVLKTWQLTLKEFGFHYSTSQLQMILGITMQAALSKLNIEEKDFEEKWLKNYGMFADEACLYHGVKSILEYLKENNTSLGIVTSRSRWEFNTYFEKFHFENLFPIIICADDTERHKPLPDPIYKYLELSHSQKSECIYIGDMPTDMKCAENAGISSGFAAWSRTSLSFPKADFRFDLPEDLKTIN